MLADVGIAAIFLAFIAACLGVLLALVGITTHKAYYVTSARNALLTTLPLILLAAGLLIYAQLNRHYEISYVNTVSKDTQPTLLKITALWGSQAGSLLLWTLMMSIFTSAALILNWKSEQHLMAWVIVVAGFSLAFFLLLNNFYENPFERFWLFTDGHVETDLFQPDNAQLAYPYQTADSQFFHPNNTATFPNARYDGRGLNPLLRHPGMVIHPPMLYLGFTGFMMPFAFAMAALLSGQLSDGWIRATRRWSVVAWMFLSIGLILGGRWAYDVLGWGGYWGWDPVENSSFLPWLTGTAFLHSVQIQERRGMLRGWNMVMIILTYLLVVFGTVATRTGLLSSVHTFAQSPLATPMGLFLAFSVVVSVGVFIWRGWQGAFENDHTLESMFSRESLFLFNNWIFLALTVVVFWGTWSELITSFLRDFGILGNSITLGIEYYELIIPWLFLILFVLMGIAPLAAWRKASAERLGKAIQIPTILSILTFLGLVVLHKEVIISMGFAVVAFAGFATLVEVYKGVEARHRTHKESIPTALINLFSRNRRRYGGYTIHIGIVIIGIGIIASTAFQEVRDRTLLPGETLDIGPYTMRYDRFFQADAIDGREMFIAEAALFRGNKQVDTLRPRRDFFEGAATPMTIAGTHSTLENDVYALITFWDGDQVTFRVYRNPLINFVWSGGILLVLGTLIAVYPDTAREPVRYRRTQLVSQPIGAGD